MQKHTSVPIKNSISTQLLKVVFSMYLVLVVTLTTIHLSIEYLNTKTSVVNELQSLEMTIKTGISRALWEMNIPQTRSIMEGIVQLPIIVGIQIKDHNNKMVGQIGHVPNGDGRVVVYHSETKDFKGSSASLFGHTFPLYYSRGDQEFPVGNITLYSNSGVVFDRIKVGFLLLIMNALIQIVVFWALFLWISRVKLSRPLAELTHAAGQLDLDNLENFTFQVHTSGRNELKILEETFNAMIQKLFNARQNLMTLNQTLQQHQNELEHRVDDRTAALHQSESHLRALFAGMSDLVLLLDDDGRYLRIAPTSPELLYKPAKDMIGKTLHEVHPKEQADFFLAHIHHSVKTQQLVSLEYSLEINGKDLWFDSRISPMSDSQVVFVARDITERKFSETQLLDAKETAENANLAKSSFLANMSHELRTPLNAVIGFSDLMTRDPSLSREQQGNLSTIVRSGEHLLSLINDVLEFSKIEAGKIILNKENFNLHHLLSDLEDMFQVRAEEKGLYLDINLSNEVPQYINTDQNKLRQILINLLGNAVKFTKTGGITLLVTIKIPDQNKALNSNQLHFKITDTGIGISPSEQDNIFSAFFQTNSQRESIHGTGLGLPISKKIVDIMGGSISLTSKVEKGSQFIIKIPVYFPEHIDSESKQMPRRVMGLMDEQPAFRLLVVEDNENNRMLLVKLLKTIGFEVKEAVNGQEAIEICDTWQPHLIWMDMRMPVMNGYEATERIKNSPIGNQIVIIALTASAFEEDRLNILEHGGDDFVRKPFREHEIFEMLSKHLEVQFIYDEKEGNSRKITTMPLQEMQQAISQLSFQLKNEFKEAIEKIDFDQAVSLLDKIKNENEMLANALAKPVKGYQFDILQMLFEKEE